MVSFAKDTRKPRRRTEFSVAPTAMRSMILFFNNVHWHCTDLVSARTCKEEAPISQDRRCIWEVQAIADIRPGRERWSEFPPISSGSHSQLCFPPPSSLAVAPCCSPSTTEHFQLYTIHRVAALHLQPVALCAEQCSLLALTSGQGCRATWANDQQDNPVTEGACSFAKAADIWVKNLDHIQHITVSNQISCNCWLNSISMLTRLACVVEKYVYRTNQWHQISDYNALDSLKVWSMHLHFLIIKVVHMKQYFKQEQGLLFL